MKYYNIQQNPVQAIKKVKAEEPERIINEEGEVINNDAEMSDGNGHQEDLGIDDLVEPENVVIGFEDNPIPLEGPLGQEPVVNNLKDMFRVDTSNRFNAFGGTNQKIQLNPFAIRKQVDVKRLKFQLWDNMKPKLEKTVEF
jgi:hypothetical protein